jgi:hypothetical protein
MAKILEEIITIKLSKIVKNDAASAPSNIDTELLSTLETVIEEMLGDGWVIEATAE